VRKNGAEPVKSSKLKEFSPLDMWGLKRSKLILKGDSGLSPSIRILDYS